MKTAWASASASRSLSAPSPSALWIKLDLKGFKAQRRVGNAASRRFKRFPGLPTLENPNAVTRGARACVVATRRDYSRAFLETVMAEYSSKSDQIRKLREARVLAAERVDAEREADAKRDSKSPALKKASKADT